MSDNFNTNVFSAGHHTHGANHKTLLVGNDEFDNSAHAKNDIDMQAMTGDYSNEDED